MAASNVTTLPTVTQVVEQQYLIEPLQGPRGPISYLDRFPDEVYSKSPESHLVRLMVALLGPAGVAQLHAAYLDARLALEDHGIELFNLELFYGSPFQFGRILVETYDSDPSGLLSQDEWDAIRAKDSMYRSRAIDFFNGVRAGNSPEGMRLVARSGVGHDVQIIENYKALFDRVSDDPIGVPFYGQTTSTAEMIVLPRHESSASAVQQIILSGVTGGTFQLGFGGAVTGALQWPRIPSGLGVLPSGSGGTFAAGTYYWVITATDATGETIASNEVSSAIVLNGSAALTWTAVPGATGYNVYRGTATGAETKLISSPGTNLYTDTGAVGSTQSPPTTSASSSALNASAAAVQAALEGLATIGKSNVRVTGGPALVSSATTTTLVVDPYQVLFTNRLAAQPVPLLTSINNLTGSSPTIGISTTTNGVDSADETASIPPADWHALETAVDRIRPVGVLPTFYQGSGTRRRQPWTGATASSETVEVLRYVSGQSGVPWPTTFDYQWIEKNVEKEAPRSADGRDRHYENCHNIVQCVASSAHIGRFSAAQTKVFRFLAAAIDDEVIYDGQHALADYPDPLNVTSILLKLDPPVSIISHVYPAEYLTLPGVPDILRKDNNFWASNEAASGTETLIIDLGTPQAINFLSFEVSRKPVDLLVEYDSNDDGAHAWHAVTPDPYLPYPDSVGFSSLDQSPWAATEMHFTDRLGTQIFARYIRISFARKTTDVISQFLDGAPFSIEVRNLRIGRNVA